MENVNMTNFNRMQFINDLFDTELCIFIKKRIVNIHNRH